MWCGIARHTLFLEWLRQAGQRRECIHVAIKNADVNLITKRIYFRYCQPGWSALGLFAVLLPILALLVLDSDIAHADGYVLEHVGGSLNYGYGYAKSDRVESESNNIGLLINTNAYIWQPWFITHGMSFGVSFVNSTTKGLGKNSGKSVTGSTEINVFPVSRFPSYLSYSVSDSVNESFEDSSFNGRHFTNTRLLFRQSYIGESNFFSSLNYVKVNTSGEGIDSETQNVDVRMRKRIPKHNFDAGFTYLTSDSLGATSKPEQYSLNAAHSFLPGPTVSINNSVSYHLSTSKAFSSTGEDRRSDGTQLASYFSWRPDYKPVSITGGARVSSTESLTETSSTSESTYGKDYGANVGASFMMSTRARVTALATASSGNSNEQSYSNNSMSGTYTYSSDQYLLAGFNYGYGFNGTASRLSSQTKDKLNNEDTNVETNSGVGVSHRANRTWLVGRASSLNLGLAQGAAAQVSGKTQGSGTITHSLSSGLATHTLRGTTFLSLAASDSRSVIFHNLTKDNEPQTTPITEFQNISLSLSRTHYLNRYSDMSGELAFASNRINSSFAGVDQSEINSGSRAALHYQHSRLFTVYGMSLQSDLTYSNSQSKEGRLAEDVTLYNKIYYSIGQLITSLNLTVAKNAGSTPRYSLFFRATRSF